MNKKTLIRSVLHDIGFKGDAQYLTRVSKHLQAMRLMQFAIKVFLYKQTGPPLILVQKRMERIIKMKKIGMPRMSLQWHDDTLCYRCCLCKMKAHLQDKQDEFSIKMIQKLHNYVCKSGMYV